uniref:Cation/H+ exchanger protein 1 n=1 Tax=Scleropages formosus TaxID=113540 RepID=A0A8C9WQW3_SCLFO
MSSSIPAVSVDVERRRRRSTADSQEPPWDHEPRGQRRGSLCDRLCVGSLHPELMETVSPALSYQQSQATSKCLSGQRRYSSPSRCPHGSTEMWDDGTCKTTIRAENEVEAHKQVNNYRFGFRKWKSHVTERPFEDRSDIVKELYSELNFVKPYTGSLVTCGNIIYVLLFAWWISLMYMLVSLLMFLTVIGVPYGKLCLKLSYYFLWPFGKSIQKGTSMMKKCCVKFPNCEAIPEVDEQDWTYHTYVWLFLGYPPLCVVHILACLISWMLVFTIPVAKMNVRTMASILVLSPEEVHITFPGRVSACCETKTLLCCYHAFNWYYYKYAVDGINVFAVNLLPLVIITLVIGYADEENRFVSSEVKFVCAISSIMPLSYYIGMGIASISAQSNFAVGAVVNATFGSIIELTFYITALLQGHHAGTKCYEEIVKSALTGTLLGCILFIPGMCMIVGGCRHQEQRFNSRSAGVSSALLFISVGGVFTPTLFSKAYGNLVCDNCSNIGINGILNQCAMSCRPLVYTVSILLPVAYLTGLIFTLKTHSHIYDIHISGCQVSGHHGAVVHWSRWRALLILIVATLLMSACADLVTEHLKPILVNSSVSQYFIGVTVLAMVPEIPEVVNGIQFALQNNMSLSLEVGSCLAVQVCMLQIPLLILFNAFYDVGFVLIFSDLHLWSSIFSVILVNYIFMDGKSDYFQGKQFALMAVHSTHVFPLGVMHLLNSLNIKWNHFSHV